MDIGAATARGLLSVVLSCLVSTLLAPAGLAAIKSEDVQKIVKDAGLWSDARLNVVCGDNEVRISTYRDSKESDRDCKIDSVLITRRIMEASPGITRVTLQFYDRLKSSEYKQIEVRESDIAAFAGKLIDNDKLLSGISIVIGEERPQVGPGPFAEERAAIKEHIGQLQSKGVGIAPYMRLFSEVEELAAAAAKEPSASPDALRESLSTLLKKLDAQELSLQQLRQKQALKLQTAISSAASASARAAVGASTAQASQGFSRVETLGHWVPVEGPYLLDRIKIGRKLAQLEQDKFPIQGYVDYWRRMEVAASGKQDSEVKTNVDYLNLHLDLPPVTDAERQRITIIKTQP
jgi:hypothetical protein